jgi:hypothetical protein
VLGTTLSLSSKAVDYAVQIASGLAAAHDQGLVHRDLKPENVFLLADGQVKILDFGLARPAAVGSGSGATQTVAAVTDPGMVMGTVGYMAPEQIRGQAVDGRCDVFAFGAVLYEMLTVVESGADQRRTASTTPMRLVAAFAVVAIAAWAAGYFGGARSRSDAGPVVRLDVALQGDDVFPETLAMTSLALAPDGRTLYLVAQNVPGTPHGDGAQLVQ